MKNRSHSSPAQRSGIQPPARRARKPAASGYAAVIRAEQTEAQLAAFQAAFQAQLDAVRKQAEAAGAAAADAQAQMLVAQQAIAAFTASAIAAMEQCASLTDSAEARATMAAIIAPIREKIGAQSSARGKEAGRG